MNDESDAMPLGDDELSPEERRALRRLLREDERMTWMRRKLKVILPAVVAAVAAAVAVWDWVVKHIRVVP